MAFFVVIEKGNFTDIYFFIFWNKNIDFSCKTITAFNMVFLTKLLVRCFLLVKTIIMSIAVL